MRGRWLTPDAPSSGYICRLLRIPNSVECEAIVSGALDDLQNPGNFEAYGALTAQETADLFAQMFEDYRVDRGCMIGIIFAYATTNTPAGALACDGATYLRTDYPALYAVLATPFITDADHFVVPDLRGRAPVGTGTGSGLTARALNDSGGEEAHVLTVSELPAHHHQYILYGLTPTSAPGTPGLNPVSSPLVNTTDTGGGSSHNNMPPFRALKFAIWAV
jgi:microcystin-dependent protein